VKYYSRDRCHQEYIGKGDFASLVFNECAFDDNKFEIRFYTETGEFYFGWSREMNESGKYNLGPIVPSGFGPLTRMLVVRGEIDGKLVAYYSNWFTVTVDTGSLAKWLPLDELNQSFHRSATKN